MIRTIQSVKGFGVFSSFKWPAGLCEFKRYNLVYGWNYSGKTTLSRILRCFEKGGCHPDFAGAQAEVKTADGAIRDLESADTVQEIRVFNTDFVRENLRFDIAEAEAVLVLGADEFAKRDELKRVSAELDAARSRHAANESARKSKQDELGKLLSKCARDSIKNGLQKPDYDKPKFQPKVEQCQSDPGRYILDDSRLQSCLATYRSDQKKPELPLVALSLSSVATLQAKAEQLLARAIASSVPITRFENKPDLERWVDEGRKIHGDGKNCPFCLQELPADLLRRYAEHFSADYEDLMAGLQALLREIDSAQRQSPPLCHPSHLYPELSTSYEAETKRMGELIARRKAALETLCATLAEKQKKAFTSLASPPIEDLVEEIAKSAQALNGIIAEHNRRTRQFETERQHAFQQIELHHAALFAREERYQQRQAEIATLGDLIIADSEAMRSLASRVRELEQSLSNAAKGAERINGLLDANFGKSDLRIEASGRNGFQLMRGTVPAKNLSEGERTAIGFAYFITWVQDGRRPLGDLVVVVDDPISSLDANHVFNTYALLKTQLCEAKQLIVLTHNFEFYNLMREWLIDDENDKAPEKWKRWAAYIVRRRTDGSSVIAQLPGELLRFRSEYHYLFSCLYAYDTARDQEFEQLLALPNLVRRFMEAFGGIMIPTHQGLRGKMSRLFKDEVERERVWKFINHYSHQTSVTRSLTIPDTSECGLVVRACLKAVENWNADYYADLVSEVFPKSGHMTATSGESRLNPA